ncbi:hypothetical protein K0M31_005372, partial [Melipona bicolor]
MEFDGVFRTLLTRSLVKELHRLHIEVKPDKLQIARVAVRRECTRGSAGIRSSRELSARVMLSELDHTSAPLDVWQPFIQLPERSPSLVEFESVFVARCENPDARDRLTTIET